MTQSEKIAMVQVYVGDESNVVTPQICESYLALAKSEILNRLHPFGVPDGVDDIPNRYVYTQCKYAAYMIIKRGAEGEFTHTENGIARQYNSEDEILKEITPMGGVV